MDRSRTSVRAERDVWPVAAKRDHGKCHTNGGKGISLGIWLDDHDVATAFDLFDRALAISNCNVTALANNAFTLAWMGKADIAVERALRALRFSPPK